MIWRKIYWPGIGLSEMMSRYLGGCHVQGFTIFTKMDPGVIGGVIRFFSALLMLRDGWIWEWLDI